MIWFLCVLGLLAACATHHASRVSCDSNLRADGPLADPASTKHLDGAP
jgi:hypothetical protein